MKNALIFSLLAVVMSVGAWAQDRIYRCGNEYTNSASSAKSKDCKLVEGGNVTVVPSGNRPPSGSGASPANARVNSSPAGAPRVDNSEQKARDSDARSILEAELRRAETNLANLEKEYNGGNMEKQGIEGRNHQRYLDRVAEMKAQVDRAAADVAGIKRELGRLKTP